LNPGGAGVGAAPAGGAAPLANPLPASRGEGT
jgi:hypothetical protein